MYLFNDCHSNIQKNPKLIGKYSVRQNNQKLFELLLFEYATIAVRKHSGCRIF